MGKTWRGKLRPGHGRKVKFPKPWLSGREADYFRRQNERWAVRLLELMVQEGSLDRFVHHKKNSVEDKEGKDFTVWKDGVERSFGVTIRGKDLYRRRALLAQRGIELIHVTRAMTNSDFRRCVLVLFENQE